MAVEKEELIKLNIKDIEVLDNPPENASIGTSVSFFDTTVDLETLAAEQGVCVVSNFDNLLGNFWPEEEATDDFITTVRRWRHEGETMEGQ